MSKQGIWSHTCINKTACLLALARKIQASPLSDLSESSVKYRDDSLADKTRLAQVIPSLNEGSKQRMLMASFDYNRALLQWNFHRASRTIIIFRCREVQGLCCMGVPFNESPNKAIKNLDLFIICKSISFRFFSSIWPFWPLPNMTY